MQPRACAHQCCTQQYKLVRSFSTSNAACSTGYMCVYKRLNGDGTFYYQVLVTPFRERQQHLYHFSTAEEAAMWYARFEAYKKIHPLCTVDKFKRDHGFELSQKREYCISQRAKEQAQTALKTQHHQQSIALYKGLTLRTSSNATGYKYVYKSNTGPVQKFTARLPGLQGWLGTFDTVIDAAHAVAECLADECTNNEICKKRKYPENEKDDNKKQYLDHITLKDSDTGLDSKDATKFLHVNCYLDNEDNETTSDEYVQTELNEEDEEEQLHTSCLCLTHNKRTILIEDEDDDDEDGIVDLEYDEEDDENKGIVLEEDADEKNSVGKEVNNICESHTRVRQTCHEIAGVLNSIALLQ